ncbi:MAG: ribosome recycling factor [Patescibacteria group bacterium]|jgi:ribosome recycling factor
MGIIENYNSEFNSAMEHFRQDIATLKTGRANPAMFDSLRVEAYGVLNPINQIASVSSPEARSIIIAPWDKGLLKDIEKAIRDSDMGYNPSNEGDKIRITIPQMTEESRKEIVKHLNQKAEQARITIRMLRDKIKEEILEAEKNKEFGEDERYSLMENLDKKTGELNDQIKEIASQKEVEIMTI